MIIKWWQIAMLGVLALGLIQCTSTDGTHTPGDSLIPTTNEVQDLETQPISDSQNPSDPSNEPQMTPTVFHPVDSGLQSLIDLVKEDLAQRLSISLTQISLVEARDVVWPDSSLGCPQPGMLYTQVLTSGSLIILEANEGEYEYHGSRNTVVHCKNPMPPVSGTPLDQ